MDVVPPRSTSRSHGKTSRPSQSQPHHRRPAWAKTERAYHRYIENPTIRPRNREDYGYDNFTYWPPHLPKSFFPQDLLGRLPEPLRDEAKLFILAFAAVHTAFDRIDALKKDAVNRADPQTTHPHLLPRRTSDQASAVGGAEIPASDTPETPRPPRTAPYTPGSKQPLIQTVPQLPVNMFGLESPPFTPVDSKVANTPVYDPANAIVAADLARVNDQLSKTALTITPISSTSDNLGTIKNEIAWQTFIKQYNAEIQDVKHHAFKRLEGYDRTITRQVYEHLHDDDLKMDQKAALHEFQDWWMDVKKKVDEIKVKVVALEEKKLDDDPESDSLDKTSCGPAY